MTVDDLMKSEKPMLTPDQIAPILGCNAQWIRATAKENPQQLGFPVTVIGTRTKIPRLAFLKFLGYEVS